MHVSIRTAASGLIMLTTLVCAALASDVMQKAVNDPGAFWLVWGNAKVSYIADTHLKGGAAQRVTVSPKPSKTWDAGVQTSNTKPVQKGDVLLLMFWAYAEKPPTGSDLVMLTGSIYETNSTNGPLAPEATFIIGKQWKLYYANATAAKDYPPGGISAGMLIGTGEQVIKFGPVALLDFGPGYNIHMLPHN